MVDQYEETKDILSICDKISNLENYTADVILSDELKEIYAQIQLKCNDFRNNIFFRNLEYLEDNLVLTFLYNSPQGLFDRTPVPHTYNNTSMDKLIKEVKMPSDLLRFYTKKAETMNLPINY